MFSLFVFTWHGAGKGPDRFYAWLDALSHLKRRVLCRFFNLYLYILFCRLLDNFICSCYP
ncbi:hypothetical protein BW425_15660 [Bacillus pseudomycoides]|uniref:Uncharacterized protein n=1 Tax=Bacillus pseudomycoides TaxID=64104 RepID=A0A1Y3MBW4_9BACI|nr:hypothetical protein BW425_15660 [Bacillus pseudomycoides]